MARDVRRAVAARDAATARVRRVTVAVVAVGAALTAALSSLAAASTHIAKTTRPARHPGAHASHRTSRPVVAPAPPLVGDGSAAAAPPPAPAPAPAPPAAAPVVVSGGS